MAETKNLPNNSLDGSSITGILDTILKFFNIKRIPLTPLPPRNIIIGSQIRPGLSAQSIAAEIISKQSDVGRVVGDVFADGPNVEEAMEYIRIKAIVDAILTDAKIEVVIRPGIGVKVEGAGNLGAPVVSLGKTISIGVGDAIIR